MFGLVGMKPIALHQKRMLSSMTPTIVEKTENYLWLWVPGGSTIITSVLQTILNVYEHDLSMQQAVNASVFHQWLPI
jgi:gamma-glutamyltranspeptidase/glutathione hydrolase